MNVPFVDLKAQHEELRAEIAAAIDGVVLEAKHRAFASLERHHQTDALTVLRDMADAERAHALRVAPARRRRRAIDQDFARGERANAGERLQQLRLPISGDAGDADDLAFA